MWYVNDILCYTESRKDEMVMFYFAQGHRVVIKPVPRDHNGRYIIPINDPMEQ